MKTADLWFNGLHHIQKTNRLHSVLDFSATPMFITRSGSRSNTQTFPWTSLRLPADRRHRVRHGKDTPGYPVEDDTRTPHIPVYRNLYENSAGKTKQKRGELTSPLHPALGMMYEEYLKTARDWEGSRTPRRYSSSSLTTSPTPRRSSRTSAGYPNDGDTGDLDPEEPWMSSPTSTRDQPPAQGDAQDHPGPLQAGPGDQDHRALQHHHETADPSLPTGDAPAPLAPGRQGHPEGGAEHRRQGRREPGEKVRCVVSVAMLTEGWDTKTVTHVVGFRRFGTQLLCEQVAGRSLRRVVYDRTNDQELFEPEYADIVGIPFEITFRPREGAKTAPPVETYEVYPLESEGQAPGLLAQRHRIPDGEYKATDTWRLTGRNSSQSA